MLIQKDWSKKGRADLRGFFCVHAAGIYGGRKFTIYGARSLHKLGIVVSLSLSQTTKNKKKRPANKQPKQDKTPALFLCLLYSAVGGRPTLLEPDAGPAETPTPSGVGTRGRRRPMAGSRRPRRKRGHSALAEKAAGSLRNDVGCPGPNLFSPPSHGNRRRVGG